MAEENADKKIIGLAKDYFPNNDKNKEELIRDIDSIAEKYDDDTAIKVYNCLLSEYKEPEILCEIIRCEDKYRDKSSLPILIDILIWKTTGNNDTNRDDYINVRVMAAKAIANIKDTSAVNSLLYCLNNKNENYKIRFACADALGKIGDRFAVAPLIDVVKDENEKSIYLRESAASALGMLGDLRAVDSLVGILETKNGILDKFTFLKERVLEALSKLNTVNDKRVFKALKNSLIDESPQIRINAIEALMDSETNEAYELIKEKLQDSNDEVKKNALIALYNMRGRTILEEVIESKEFSSYIKAEAQSIIEEYETGDNNE